MSLPEPPRDAQVSAIRRHQPRLRKLAFSLVASVVGLALLELLLAAFGVRPVFYDDPFVGFASGNPLFQEVRQANGTVTLSTSPSKLKWFNEQTFQKRKAPGTYRIFCLGGSTTMGRPYSDATSFSGWLREFLTVASPHRQYEVINAGGISYASYRVARVMAELAEYEPDMFIVYTGHNEFLERHTYGSLQETPAALHELNSLCSRTRVYSAIYRLVKPASLPRDGSGMLPSDVDAVLDRTLGPESYHRDNAARDQVLSHFAHTLERLVDIARHAGAEIVFVDPSSNLRDCRPFKSQHRNGLLQQEVAEWQRLTRQVEQLIESGEDVAQALEIVDAAIQIDDQVADLHFERARLLWSLGQFDDSRTAFIRARDEDVCPLRALSQTNQILREVAEQKSVPLIPFASSLESQSAHGVPGAEQFLDHVHPTIAGHQFLADLILKQLAEMGVVELAPTWNSEARQTVIDRVESRLDPQVHALAIRNLAKVLTWAGKFDEADRLALQAVTELPDDYDAHFLAGNAEQRRGNHEDAISHFEMTVRLNPAHAQARNNLGNEYFQAGKLELAETQFKECIRIDPDFATGFHNLGVIHFTKGNAPEAIRYFTTALRLEPNRFDTHHTLSKLYYRDGEYRNALHHLRIAGQVRPDDQDVQRDLIWLTQKLNE